MTAIIFCGPTLSAEDARNVVADIRVRPPAERGDVLRAALDQPTVIGLVDGYFAHRPSVWHKEILWAMSKGIRVLGAGSMGALRAAELAPFGMEGIGVVFDWFVSGELLDDDEVAVIHGDEQNGYRALSEAMVNIRATLAAAHLGGIICETTKRALESLAKRLGYAERSYALVLALAEKEGMDRVELGSFQRWLTTGRVNQKRIDALAMLRRITELANLPAAKPSYRFAITHPFRALQDRVVTERRYGTAAPELSSSSDELMDELLLTGQIQQAYEAALGRAVSCGAIPPKPTPRDRQALAAFAESFRRERGLSSPSAFQDWLKAQHLGDAEVDEFFRREAHVRRAWRAMNDEVEAALIDHLRSTGQYAKLLTRAQQKKLLLDAHGYSAPELEHTRLSEPELWVWFFVSRSGVEVPEDLQAFALSRHTTVERLRRAVVREHCFCRLRDQSTGE